MANAVKGSVNTLLEKLHITSPKSNEAPAVEPSQEDLEELKKAFEEAEQEHVFAFYDELDVAGKAALYDQLVEIKPAHINEISQKALGPAKSSSKDESEEASEDDSEDASKESPAPDVQPLPSTATASLLDSPRSDLDEWYGAGLKLIADNQVGVVLMAGGQGTRLGSSDPKGCYDIGLPSEKSLFQLQAERILKIQRLAAAEHKRDETDVVVPWYIMTSGPTRKPTQAFFEQHAYFGLERANVHFFEQGVLPCISNDGKILLEAKGRVAVAPDGNGGLYMAMFKDGVLADMEKRGVRHVHAYCVDNCLVRVADPTFMGFAAGKGVDLATKVVRKRNAKESVGLIVQKDGKPDVIEYSEMDAAMAEAKEGDLLKFRAANIVNHYYSLDFLQTAPTWAHKLPHHVARKKIPHVDAASGESVKPEQPNGIKLEQFVFDCFPLVPMAKFACLEVKREEEFSPLKNAKGKGEDDPDTSRRDILQQCRRWIEAVEGVVVSEKEEDGVDISPLISYGGEGLEFLAGKEIKAPAVIEKQVDKA